MRNTLKNVARAVCVIALVLLPITAPAQRASENAVTSAQDAFGTTVGDDSIGLYGSTNARGFSPKDAGNMSIEGLFYLKGHLKTGQ